MDPPPVHLQLLFSRPSGADAAAQPGKRAAEPGQPGRPVSELGQLHLELSFTGGCPGRKDVQDHHGPVHDLYPKGLLKVFKLGRGKLVIADHPRGFRLFRQKRKLRELAAPQISDRMCRLPSLDQRLYGNGPGSPRKK